MKRAELLSDKQCVEAIKESFGVDKEDLTKFFGEYAGLEKLEDRLSTLYHVYMSKRDEIIETAYKAECERCERSGITPMPWNQFKETMRLNYDFAIEWEGIELSKRFFYERHEAIAALHEEPQQPTNEIPAQVIEACKAKLIELQVLTTKGKNENPIGPDKLKAGPAIYEALNILSVQHNIAFARMLEIVSESWAISSERNGYKPSKHRTDYENYLKPFTEFVKTIR